MLAAPHIKKVESFLVTGFSVETQNKDEFNPETAKIPSVWQQVYASNLPSVGDIYGVYSDYESDANGLYTLTVGIASNETRTQDTSVIIQAGKYLVFEGRGPMLIMVIATWQQIWTYFEDNHDYQRQYVTDFEIYAGPEQVDIYIGIKDS